MPYTFTIIIYIALLISYTNGNAQHMKDSIINDNSFKIKEVHSDSYKGVFKNGKPYSGYFKKGDKEFYTVDFYEKGIPMYQYSMDIMNQMEQEEFVLDIKSTYKNGKIFNGWEVLPIKNGILCKNWNDGKLQEFYQDIFAMHYYNRINFTKQKDTILISNHKEKGYQIKLFTDQDSWIIQLVYNNQILIHQQTVNHRATVFPKNSRIGLFIKDDARLGFAYEYKENMFPLLSEADINKRIFDELYIPDIKEQDIVLEHLCTILVKTEGLSIERTTENMPAPMGAFDTNNKGAILSGIRCIEDESRTFYRIYENEKIIKEEDVTINEFKKIYMDYFKR